MLMSKNIQLITYLQKTISVHIATYYFLKIQKPP